MIDARPAAIGFNAMVHYVTDFANHFTRHVHDFGSLAVDVGNRGKITFACRPEFRARHRHTCWPVKILQRFADCGREVGAVEVPLAGDVVRLDLLRNALGRGSTQRDHFRVGQFSRADLNAVHPPLATFVRIGHVAVREKDGRR